MPHVAPWFPDAKFGIFIHWTLKNWAMEFTEAVEITPDLQRQWAREHFTAERFDARAWAKQFKAWGANYAVLTTKHHIGFALFDAPGVAFGSAVSSPAKRDIVAEFCEGMRAEGIKVGLYYSLPDWSHPDYQEQGGADKDSGHPFPKDPAVWERFSKQMFAEIEHLCTAYGKIDLMWFDGDWERTAEQWKSVELAAMIERLQPGIVLNNRLRHKCIGHYGTPETTYRVSAPAGLWEYCGTPGANWDGQAANRDVKPPHELIRLTGDMLGMGGNVLLNIAPRFDGTIPDPQRAVLDPLGDWLGRHAEAIYGAEAGLPFGLFNGASTHRGGVLYLIAYDAPRPELVVKGLRGTPTRVTCLGTGAELPWRFSGGRQKFGHQGWLFVTVPEGCLDPYATVVKIEFEKDEVEIENPAGGVLRWRGRPVFQEKDLAAARDD